MLRLVWSYLQYYRIYELLIMCCPFAEEKSMLQEDMPIPEHPEVVVFASYCGPPKYPVRISVLGEMVRF